jgi:hypothetical protein
VAPLSTAWQPYALPPQAFRFWTGPEGRGKAGDAFQPANADHLTIGVADTHTTELGHGPHTIWIDEVGAAAPPEGLPDLSALFGKGPEQPVIEAVSPRYKIYPVTTTASLRPDPYHVLPDIAAPPAPATLQSPHPRPDGSGLHKGRHWRFVPLLEALDAAGQVAGTPVALVLSGAVGGTVLSAPVTDPAWFAAPETRAWLGAAARRMLDGVFLYEGGAAWYASFGGENVPIGAVVGNRGRQPAEVTVHAVVRDAGGRQVWAKDWPVTVAPGAAVTVEAPFALAAEAGPQRVTVELRRGESIIDQLAHDLRVWRPSAQPHWVTIDHGEFRLDGRQWTVHGVNYMPSTGIGSEDGPYFERWVSAQSYDPAVVERDLTRIEQIGFNAVSVFIYRDDLEARNLLDLLMRCEAHHLKANVSLRPGSPLDFPWPRMRELVTALKLAENDTVFAYDLDWEPNWGAREELTRWDGAWNAWIAKTYGSLAAATAAWGYSPRVAGNQIAGPSNDEMTHDGAWRKMVVDYRRFLNDLLNEKYGGARTLMRSIDPHHAVSFRMSGAGDPLWEPPHSSYDFAGLAKAVDLYEPEGYGRIGDWERVKVGIWTIAYARACNPDLPVIWAEFGNTLWSGSLNGPDPKRMESITRWYDDFYKMIEMADGNGSICWWYPGGFRVGENSDFGVINPDGSWRPITQVIHDWAPKLTAPRPRRPVTDWIGYDPAAGVRGVTGIYEQTQAAFWRSVAAGGTPGLRAAR